MVNTNSTCAQALKKILENQKPNLILAGFMGTGKTTVSKYLAQHLGRPWIDTDGWLYERYGMTPAEIIKKYNEDHLRSLEDACAQDLPNNGHIIATGGGMLLNPKTAKHVKQKGCVIVLDTSPEVILERIGPVLAQRPLIDPTAPLQSIRNLLQARAAAYRALGPLVDAKGSVASVAQAVAACYALYTGLPSDAC
jgi:shikimate kinase